MHQMDVNNAFLRGFLTEHVYCQQSTGFVNERHTEHVCILDRSLNGLKHSPKPNSIASPPSFARLGSWQTLS